MERHQKCERCTSKFFSRPRRCTVGSMPGYQGDDVVSVLMGPGRFACS